MKTLYISYFGALKHLSHSQVLPYLKEMARGGIEVTFLSFEERLPDPKEEKRLRAQMGAELRACGIDWRPLRYHKRPSLPATAFDVLAGILYGAYLVVTKQIDVIHARNHVPGLMALVLRACLGCKLLFDMRGVMAEEYVDSGYWRVGSLPYRLVKWVERELFEKSDSMIMLTHRIKAALTERHEALRKRDVPIEVIPCCVDLEQFRMRNEVTLRQELGLEGKTVLVYAGNVGGRYLTAELARFFAAGQALIDLFHFLILTQADHAHLTAELEKQGVRPDNYTILTVAPDEVSRYLSLADFGIHLIRPGFSILGNSPTKISEYLACGLPIVVSEGSGDLDSMLLERQIGVTVKEFDVPDYLRAVRDMLALLEDRRQVQGRCRKAAEEIFSLKTIGGPSYLRAYGSLGWSGEGMPNVAASGAPNLL